MRDVKKEVIIHEEYDGDGNLIKKTVKTTEREFMPEEDNKWGYHGISWNESYDDPTVGYVQQEIYAPHGADSHPLHPRTSEG
jgi:hypothetical protein